MKDCRKCRQRTRARSGLCVDCQDIEDASILYHSVLVRCPYCGATTDPQETEQYELFEDGDHETWCAECDKYYTVGTMVSYTFVSPVLEKTEEERGQG